jgi:hypothetical protein
MAVLQDYTDLLNPRSIPSETPGTGSSLSGSAVPISSYLPTTSYATTKPAAVNVTPAMVNFNPKSLPGAYQASNVAPDWQNIIASNPDYMQWSLGAGERADTAASQRRAAMRALAIRFGGLPSNFSDVYGDIDPTTAQTAAQNPESENNRLLRSYTQNVEQQRRQLAARGMLQSGELGYGQEQLDLARQGDIYDLNNEFLNQAQGNVNDYASIVAGLNAEQIDQIRAAADRIAADKLYQANLSGGWGGGGGGGWGGDGGGGGGGGTTPAPYVDPYVQAASATYDPNDPNRILEAYKRNFPELYASGQQIADLYGS